MAEGYLDFTAGSVLTAANLEDYCESQGIMRFASAAARDTALSVIKTEGMTVYLKDVNTFTTYTGSAWSTVGPVHGGLTTYTPTWTQSGAISKTVNHSVYSRVGRRVEWNFTLTATGSGTGANIITLSLPVNSAYFGSNATPFGYYLFYDTSAPLAYHGPIMFDTTSTAKFFVGTGTGASSLAFIGNAIFSAAVASGDILSGFVTYEAAADA